MKRLPRPEALKIVESLRESMLSDMHYDTVVAFMMYLDDFESLEWREGYERWLVMYVEQFASIPTTEDMLKTLIRQLCVRKRDRDHPRFDVLIRDSHAGRPEGVTLPYDGPKTTPQVVGKIDGTNIKA